MKLNSEERALKVLEVQVRKMPELVVVLGTGWNRVMKKVEAEVSIPFSEWLGVEASVPGHEGKLVVGKIGGKRVAFMVGRLHMYEGYSGFEATLPIRVLASAGMKKLVVTSASGGLNEEYEVGDVVVLSDLLTVFLVLDNPLIGPQFLDMSKAFDGKMRKVALDEASRAGLVSREGVYGYYHGPNFETPTDKRALRTLGADVCGMSTVPETLMARWLGIKVLGLSLVTNLAFVKHSHQEVLAAAEKAGGKLGKWVEGVIKGV